MLPPKLTKPHIYHRKKQTNKLKTPNQNQNKKPTKQANKQKLKSTKKTTNPNVK